MTSFLAALAAGRNPAAWRMLLSVLLKTHIRRIIMVKHIVLYTLKRALTRPRP